MESTCVYFNLGINASVLWKPLRFLRQHWSTNILTTKENSRDVNTKYTARTKPKWFRSNQFSCLRMTQSKMKLKSRCKYYISTQIYTTRLRIVVVVVKKQFETTHYFLNLINCFVLVYHLKIKK